MNHHLSSLINIYSYFAIYTPFLQTFITETHREWGKSSFVEYTGSLNCAMITKINLMKQKRESNYQTVMWALTAPP